VSNFFNIEESPFDERAIALKPSKLPLNPALHNAGSC